MAYSNISQLIAAINAEIIANGNEEITGPVLNDILIGLTQFIEQAPINWDKAQVESGGGDIVLTDDYLGAIVFLTITPDSLSFGDNVYNEYVFVNMTAGDIPLDTPTVYYIPTGMTRNYIPANSVVNLFKAANDLWVQGNTPGGGGSTQKKPRSFKVGTTSGAPTAGATTWVNSAFENSEVILFINYGLINQDDMGNGSPYTTKVLTSTTLTINNYTGGWVAGDILDYILITP